MSGFCTQCGSCLLPDAAFCDACGEKVRTWDNAESNVSSNSKGNAHLKEFFSKRSSLFVAATIGGVLIASALGSVFWALDSNKTHPTTGMQADGKSLSTVTGRWASTRGGSVAQFEFAPETMTTSGHTVPVRYALDSKGISVAIGNPPREFARIVVVTPEEIRLEGAATATLYRIR